MTETMQQMFFLSKKNAVAIIGVGTYLCPQVFYDIMSLVELHL